jgi:hypothetical protein
MAKIGSFEPLKTQIKLVCVDDPKVKLPPKIEKVPSILSNGEVFSGNSCFLFIDRLIQTMINNHQQQFQNQQQNQQQNQNRQLNQPMNQPMQNAQMNTADAYKKQTPAAQSNQFEGSENILCKGGICGVSLDKEGTLIDSLESSGNFTTLVDSELSLNPEQQKLQLEKRSYQTQTQDQNQNNNIGQVFHSQDAFNQSQFGSQQQQQNGNGRSNKEKEFENGMKSIQSNRQNQDALFKGPGPSSGQLQVPQMQSMNQQYAPVQQQQYQQFNGQQFNGQQQFGQQQFGQQQFGQQFNGQQQYGR